MDSEPYLVSVKLKLGLMVMSQWEMGFLVYDTVQMFVRLQQFILLSYGS